MKVLFTGLGSIGTRHLKNLHAVAVQHDIPLEVYALRATKRALPQEVSALLAGEIISVQELETYDVAFITNPTHLHFATLQALKGKAKALFIEKPIFEHTAYALADCLAPAQKAYVAAPMRWCGAMLALKKEMADLQVYSARVICSSYLPDWRPNVDYRTVYSAHKDMGGGVTIDLIHEWDYLMDLFGAPKKVHNFKGTYSHLEIDSDDLSVYIAQYDTLLAEVHLDYFGRKYRRSIELFCKEGTLVADFGDGTVTLADGTVIHCEEDVNTRYIREMEYFLSYVQSDAPHSINPPQEGLSVLRLTLGEEDS